MRWTRVAAAAVAAGAALPAVLRWLRRAGAVRRSVDMRMTVVVQRPINDVFEFCRDFENFPRTVDVLLSVHDSQDGRSHWAVRSPTGQSVEWDATITKYVPNSVIGWESVPGSAVLASGLMRFAPLSPTDTRVDVSLTYRPLSTGIAEAFRALIGSSNTKRLRSEITHASHELSRAPESVAAVTSDETLGPVAPESLAVTSSEESDPAAPESLAVAGNEESLGPTGG
jgi:uncharacterized membrane protein